MGRQYKAAGIVAKLRQVVPSQGRSVAEAVRSLGASEQTCYRWRQAYGGLEGDQVKRLKEPEAENARLRRAVSDLTLEKPILKEAAAGDFRAPPAAARASSMSWPGYGVSQHQKPSSQPQRWRHGRCQTNINPGPPRWGRAGRYAKETSASNAMERSWK